MSKAWEEIQARKAMSHSVTIDATGFLDREIDKKWGDTFHWKVGPAIYEFHNLNGVSVLADMSEAPKEVVFYFPSDKADIAALFKLTFR